MSPNSPKQRRVLVTGGAGYVGARLAPELLSAGYAVRILDTFWYGEEVFDGIVDKTSLELVVGDIRDADVVEVAVAGCTDVIHLACISNDPSYDLDPKLGEDINFKAFEPLVTAAKNAGVGRFIYASSSSVYGIKEEDEVTEDLPLEPLTDYSKYKALCEPILLAAGSDDFVVTVVRPATLCGYSPRQRLDLTVNILTNHAVNEGVIRIFGGDQYRPNLHIEDMCRAYLELLAQPAEKINGQVFNIGGANLTVSEIAGIVAGHVAGPVDLRTESSPDQRSYRITSSRIAEAIGFRPIRTVDDAVDELQAAFAAGRLPNAANDSLYYNIRRMNEVIAG
jgi:nucleoside-diphosphate-sugar epimerase